VAVVTAVEQQAGDAGVAAERWRDALAQLEYAERHGDPAGEIEQLANRVIEARVAMFQSGVQSGWALPAFLQSALDRDRLLLEADPPSWDAIIGAPRGVASDAGGGTAPAAR
jgi:hypothetical protein